MTDTSLVDGEAGDLREKERRPRLEVLVEHAPRRRCWGPTGSQEMKTPGTRTAQKPGSPRSLLPRRVSDEGAKGNRPAEGRGEAGSPEWQAARARNRTISENRKPELQDQARGDQDETRPAPRRGCRSRGVPMTNALLAEWRRLRSPYMLRLLALNTALVVASLMLREWLPALLGVGMATYLLYLTWRSDHKWRDTDD